MKKSNILEIIGILSLSLLLLSAFAVSSCLPEMLLAFPDHDRASVEFLISSPSTSMVVMIALTPFLTRYLKERTMIVAGLLLCGVCGMVPVFVQSFSIISISRILMGVGIGFLNARAISLIGEHFTGTLRLKLQGIRCSMEPIGQSIMILAAGQLLRFGWNYAFLIYGIAFVILFLYLAFVPTNDAIHTNETADAAIDGNSNSTAASATSKRSLLRAHEIKIIITSFLLGMTLVSSAVSLSLRLTSYVVDAGIGSAVDGATILSISVFAGFLGGLAFGKLMQMFGHMLLPLSLLAIAVGMAAISLGGNLVVVAVGACLSNCFITVGTSYMFNRLSDELPVSSLNTGNSIVLIGCNLGSCTISFILQAIGLINPSLSFAYLCYAIVLGGLGTASFMKTLRTS